MHTILSLDGGGSWSLIQLRTLRERFGGQTTGHEVLKHFDFVISNSGGSIVLAALAEGWTLDKALDLFNVEENRRIIFHQNSFWNQFFPANLTRKWLNFGPKYNTAQKRKAFSALFPEIDKRTIGEVPAFVGKPELKIVVCTYNALANRAKFFKSYVLGKETPESVSLTDAVHASANPPIQYFDFPASVKVKERQQPYLLWDGALGGFNNPVVAAMIEAMKLNWRLEDLRIIMLGSRDTLASIEKKQFFSDLVSKASVLGSFMAVWKGRRQQVKYFFKTVMYQATTILSEPPDWANYVAMMFLKNAITDPLELQDRLIRLSPWLQWNEKTPPELVKKLDKLDKLDFDLTEDSDLALLHECFELWEKGDIRNHPIAYRLSEDHEVTYEFGDETFETAMERWRQWQ